MKTLISLALLLGSVGAAQAQYYNYGTGSNSHSNNVQGYTNSHGTQVDSYQRTNPNSTHLDNYGARGNYNPYTGNTGDRRSRY